MRTLIKGGTLVNEGRLFEGSILIEDFQIAQIYTEPHTPEASYDEVIDASGCFVLPGIIDDHVHFREPGLTAKADIESESRAAAAGGVTTYFDMPNTVPQTTTLEALEEKFALAAQKSHVNYSFFFGATNDNAALLPELDQHRIPGVKLFMGSSTGNMLVDRREALEKIFASSTLPIMTHCEDTDIINRNMAAAIQQYGDDPKVTHHPEIRSEEACYESTKLAVELAKKHDARLHIAHLTTAKELELLEGTTNITAEATVSHLYFCDRDYSALGTRIKCNPSVKSPEDQAALHEALTSGKIDVVATDHAPHLLNEKVGGALKAMSGMPLIQFSLVSMLELSDKGVLPLEHIPQLMSHNPARLYKIRDRGFIRKGYYADLVLVDPNANWQVGEGRYYTKCGWTPMDERTFKWKVVRTLVNGVTAYVDGIVIDGVRGSELVYD